MSTLLERERRTYSDMWSVPAYATGSPGAMLLPIFLDMSHTVMRTSVLDAGCGSGKGALALREAGFGRIELCDLTSEGLLEEAKIFPFHEVVLWEDLRPTVGFFDWVYCCDVLEHIPPTFAMLVISRLLEVTRRGLFLSITMTPDVMGAWIGKPLHQCLQDFVSWRDQLDTIGELIEARDLLNAGCFLVKPRGVK